jgi:hypothetical protein
MKTRTFTILILAVILTSCEKVTLENMSVDKYIRLLKSGNYDYIELPPFNSDDIPGLMKYIDDKQIIENFPVNPVSSLYAPDCNLGIYAIWTIESIRVSSIVADAQPFRFPSLIPALMFRNPDFSGIVDTDLVHQEVVKAYQDWWNSNSNFQQIKNIDPLESTEYRWR